MTIQRAMDVSSHQPRDLTALIQQHQIQHVITRLYLRGESIPFEHSAAQVASAQANGCTVGGYCWAYRSFDPVKTIDDVIARCASIGLVLPLLWIDAESYTENGVVVDPGPDAEWLSRAVDHAETTYGMQCGIYTARWWVSDVFPGGAEAFRPFTRLPMWLAYYDRLPNIDVFIPFAGIEQIGCKQYTDQPVDLDVIRSEYTVYQPSAPTPAPDGCSEVLATIQRWVAQKPYRAPSRAKLRALPGIR